jgi:hypothetical protein
MILPILIAKDRNAIVLKDDYKIGWLNRDGIEWLWTVWGSAANLENAIKCANDTIKQKCERPIYLSETPLIKGNIVQTEKLDMKQLNKSTQTI